MSRIAYDTETNGLIPELTKLHCLVLHDLDTSVREGFADQPGHTPIELGLKKLEQAQMRLAHNAIGFDEKAIRKVYPWFNPVGFCVDTLVMCRVLWPDRKRDDFKLVKQGKLPGHLTGRHSLESYGHRVGKHKGDYTAWCKERGLDPWAEWRPEMQEYCDGDVDVLVELIARCLKKIAKEGWKGDWLPLEQDVQELIIRMEDRGVDFDQDAAQRLHSKLVKHKLELETKLQEAFPPITRKIPFYPKKNNKPRGYVAGQLFIKEKVEVFNPSSRKQIAERLKAKYAWEPTEFTKSGEPALDEETMSALPFVEAPILAEYLMVDKRLGQVATGKQSWLKAVKKDGRIHPRVNPMGTATSRMSHSSPPIAGTPSVRKPYGPECRACFKAGKGYVLVGCDADALELRCMAGYLKKYDGGAYIDTVLNGDKAKGTDMHSKNSRSIGWDPKSMQKVGANMLPAREISKTFFYAMIYGAFPPKLGEILGKSPSTGKKAKERILAGITGVDKVMAKLEERVKRGFIYAIDGRCIPLRSAHSAFNTLLQSAGAIFMKRAWVIADRNLQLAGFVAGDDYEWVLNIHDELQAEVRPHLVEEFKAIVQDAIRLAGEHYNFSCPLAGNAESGANWAATH